MDVTPTRPLGAVVTGLDLTDPDRLEDGDISRLRELLAEHGMLALPGQEIDDTAFTAFLRRLGELVFTAGETPVEGHPDLNVISNVGRDEPPRSTFHVDSSYFATPPSYTALRAVEIPAAGGETVFTDQYRAYDTLDPETVSALTGRTVHHVVTGVDPALLGPDDETEADHPLFRPHPLSGRTALYLTTPKRCAGISGMDDAEAARTVEELYRHSTRDDNTYAHPWAAGDVVLWDNGCVLHRGDHSVVVGNRVMHRGMVVGYGPTAGAGR